MTKMALREFKGPLRGIAALEQTSTLMAEKPLYSYGAGGLGLMIHEPGQLFLIDNPGSAH